MKIKLSEQDEAKKLRFEGLSVNEIAKILKVSKGSVSNWVQEVTISEEKILKLKAKSHSKESIEKRRISRLKNEVYKRDAITLNAQNSIGGISARELWLIGVSLYWAEGGKTQRMVRFSNGDPKMIKIMIRFFTEICKVDKAKLRGYIHIHEELDHKAAELYWHKVSEIPLSQFYKTYRKVGGKSLRRTLPYGVMDIYIMDVKLFLKIKGWAEGISQSISGYDHNE